MPKLPEPYRYKKTRKPQAPRVTNRIETQAPDEGLTGIVQGWEASDIEERFARALDKNKSVIQYSFRSHYFGPARNTPGAVEVDFMVFDGAWWPVHLDGAYAHKTAAQLSRDLLNIDRLDAYFRNYGVNKSVRIPDPEGRSGKITPVNVLDTQDSTDELVKELF